MARHKVTAMDGPETPCLPVPPRCLDAAMAKCGTPVCNSLPPVEPNLGTKLGCQGNVVEDHEEIPFPNLDLEMGSPRPVECNLGTNIGSEVGSCHEAENHDEIPSPSLDLELGSCSSPLSVECLAAQLDPYDMVGSPAGDGSECGGRSPTLCFEGAEDSDQDVDGMKDVDEHEPAAPEHHVQKPAVSCMHCCTQHVLESGMWIS